MAHPINPTPILCGEDKEKFLEDIKSVSYDKDKETYLKECESIFNHIKKEDI
ncbi:MAG TPA: hypothetical protein VFF28_03800 [Candidatus Nanoarchaeia archaeon]|nr:hypothetical protein [Candidatus Nanoarchaeia archaeon]